MNEYELGQEVEVTAREEDDFNNDFTGTVFGFRNGFIQVEDQDGDVWECEPTQVKAVE